MKKIVFALSLILSNYYAHSQNGLECVTVERYYISNAADAAQADIEATGAGYPTGSLPAGSVTYRIYADMLPGYKLLSVYADGTRIQPMTIKTTTSFYNNPSGDKVPSGAKSAIKNNLLALDSWFSLGGVANGNYGIPKTEDDGVANNITVAGNSAGVLLNNSADAGIPLTTQDGMITGTGIQAVTFSGITTEADIFTDGTVVGNSFVLNDGGWGAPNGAIGPIPATNEVLIAQMTTDGVLSFELNILVLPTAGGKAEFYVAKNPQPSVNPATGNDDIQLACLTYSGDPTNVNNANAYSRFSIHPNPVRDLLTLEVNAPKHSENNNSDSYTIYGITGNVIVHKTLGTITERYLENINMSSLAKGIYFIQLSIDGVTSTKKIIKN